MIFVTNEKLFNFTVPLIGPFIRLVRTTVMRPGAIVAQDIICCTPCFTFHEVMQFSAILNYSFRPVQYNCKSIKFPANIVHLIFNLVCMDNVL